MVVRVRRDREGLIVPSFTVTAPDGVMLPFVPADAVIVCCVIANEAAIVWFAVTFVNV